MGKRSLLLNRKRSLSLFTRKPTRLVRSPPQFSLLDPSNNCNSSNNNNGDQKAKKKKGGGIRLWMRIDKFGRSEVAECERNNIVRRVGLPVRDLRVLGPLFSNSSNILAREKAFIVNLEFVKAIVSAEEVLLLDPLCHEVIPFIEQLKQNFSHQNHDKDPSTVEGEWLLGVDSAEGQQPELPFEFQVLEIALEVVCAHMESSTADVEADAYPVLDTLTKRVTTSNLERVRSLKSTVTRLLARVQKLRDELEHLLDDDVDMAQLYLTRKQIHIQKSEALMAAGDSTSIVSSAAHHVAESSTTTRYHYCMDDVEELEMLLEAYFVQLDGIRNRILTIREHIDDTEDYVNIQLDNLRNKLMQLQLVMNLGMTAMTLDTLIVSIFGMNMPYELVHFKGFFFSFVGVTTFACFLVFLILVAHARRKKLIGC